MLTPLRPNITIAPGTGHNPYGDIRLWAAGLTAANPIANLIYYWPIVVGADTAIVRAFVYLNSGTAATTGNIGVYSDASDLPSARLGQTGAFATTATGFTGGSLSLTLTANTQYWMAFISSSGTISTSNFSETATGSIRHSGARNEAGAGSTLPATATPAVAADGNMINFGLTTNATVPL